MASHSDVAAAISRAMRGAQPIRTVHVQQAAKPKPVVASVGKPNADDAVVPVAVAVEAPAAEAQVAVVTWPDNVCTICRQPIASDHDRVQRGACRHSTHLHCMVPLIRGGRQFCTDCPSPALQNDQAVHAGGYVVDATGNDTDIRAAVLAALEYRREKASPLCARMQPDPTQGLTCR